MIKIFGIFLTFKTDYVLISTSNRGLLSEDSKFLTIEGIDGE